MAALIRDAARSSRVGILAMNRRIAVITGSRAEYGLLRPLCRAIDADAKTELLLIVTGMHLEAKFGLTVQEIESDGLPIAARIPLDLTDDSPIGVARSMGLGLGRFAECFDGLRPELVVVLGDRFEILAAAISAMLARIPIAHIHGGEATEGAVDEAIRHSITKMAQIHFPAAELYRHRIIQMGEHPQRVFNFGAAALDAIRDLRPLSRQALSMQLGTPLNSPLIVATFHPVTLETDSEAQLRAMLAALDSVEGGTLVITYPNADTGGRPLIPIIEAYAAARRGRVVAVPSLGQTVYMSLLKIADLVIGNSSSGLLEAPYFGVPTVNIGDRQRGRLAPKSVIHCAKDKRAIASAISRALSPTFGRSVRGMRHPYGNGRFAQRALRVLKTVKLGEALLKKSFHASARTRA